MEVRSLEPSEAELLHSFRLRGLEESPEAFGATYEEDLALSAEAVRGILPRPEGDFMLGAFDEEGRLVGVAGFSRGKRVKLRHRGGVWGMYVAPEARGRGVGAALLSALVERAKNMDGLELITLDVVTVNEAARRLYLSQGFRTYALEPKAMKMGGVYYDLEHMMLELS